MRARTLSRLLLRLEKHYWVARFLLVGGFAAFVFFALTFALLSAGISPFVGALIAYTVAFFVGYSGQFFWTFEGGHVHRSALPKYFIVQVSLALTCAGLAKAAALVLPANPLLLSLLTTGFASFASAVLSSRWIFPRQDLVTEPTSLTCSVESKTSTP